jgi:hypothetical protein
MYPPPSPPPKSWSPGENVPLRRAHHSENDSGGLAGISLKLPLFALLLPLLGKRNACRRTWLQGEVELLFANRNMDTGPSPARSQSNTAEER